MTRQATKNNANAALQINEDLQRQFITFVHDKVGIQIKPGHKELLKNISETCEKNQYLPSDYLAQLYKADENSEIINRLVAAITIGETYFFRDKRQIKLLKDYILPKVIKKKVESSDKTLRIWSAGCSSGEEIYTIIMLLQDLIVNLQDWKCEFLATDINIESLRKGMGAKYSEWSMRSIPEEYLTRYFTKSGNVYQLHDSIRGMVNFDYLNLNTDTYPSMMNGTAMQDLIVCRNVLIYFDDVHIKNVLDRLTRCLGEHGYILLGASDPIAFMDVGMMPVADYPSLFTKRMTPEKVILPTPDKNLVSHQQAVRQIKVEKVKQPIQSPVNHMVVTKAEKLTQAIEFANTGKTTEAIKLCEEIIAEDKMNKEAYFIYALSLAELKRNKDAESAFRKALYIDPGFLVCRYQFGLYLLQHKRHQEGLKALESAIRSASEFNDNDIVPDSNNMSYKDLVSVLKREIELYR